MIRALIFILLLSGCSILGDRRVAAGCQVADGVTTYVALEKGAVELNPIFANASPAAILVIKLAFAYWLWTHFDRPVSDAEQVALGAVTLVGCVPALNNINVIRSLP